VWKVDNISIWQYIIGNVCLVAFWKKSVSRSKLGFTINLQNVTMISWKNHA